ncbi:alpha/beta fold hydrolase [Pseudarthrobacter phenanthrenivorans]|uniref:Alpha/beta fold hydrolase n=1 Tax=Pseudarthrobacter phenanthrenivorans TaxID=361575 RepID=A0A3B0G1S9_PSEPS|nr:alpha/beta fold hydrolase [Pseudarthrobacter phenanthrenivorans]RKO26105.1 alpha/beta fold hydrolase [Pseudarthrobacter phenanthrenivorans]
MGSWSERQRTIRSNGADLAVFEYGPDPAADTPVLLLVHGYPDDHRLYLPLIRELAETFHVIAYDTRNAGSSSVTNKRASFVLQALVDDLYAVLAATTASPVHLVGHDWGSIQAWAAVQDPRAAGRISRFTSVSGPDLQHFFRWIRESLRHPRGWPQLLGQLLRSSYVAVFQIPLLPEVLWRFFLTGSYERATGRTVGNNPVHGLALYRANFQARRQPPTRVSIPVHVIVPVRDPFVSPSLTEGLNDWVPRLTVRKVKAGHWWPATHASDFAKLLRREHGIEL